MNKKAILFIISLLLILLIALGFIYTNIVNSNNANTTDNNSIKNIVNNSLWIQYSNNNTNIDRVFTNDYIDDIDKSSNFYKKNLAPYKIVDKNYIRSLIKVSENEFIVSVQIDDKNGRYIQIIHIIKERDVYLISNIEYDI